eukprot:scaffold11639_cov172-Amphora_coffeaeformis.AAC.29
MKLEDIRDGFSPVASTNWLICMQTNTQLTSHTNVFVLGTSSHQQPHGNAKKLNKKLAQKQSNAV